MGLFTYAAASSARRHAKAARQELALMRWELEGGNDPAEDFWFDVGRLVAGVVILLVAAVVVPTRWLYRKVSGFQ